MKILIDENMPYAKMLFSQFGEVITKQGRAITADDLIDVDALMCRSVTKVNAALLSKANKLSFVGTATAGFDHIDIDLLTKQGVFFTSAPGCNKVGVAEYILSALMVLSKQQHFSLQDRKIGIVGAGQVGTYLAQCLKALNIPYLLNDPIKQEQGDPRQFHSLDEILEQCDVVSLHTPMSFEGKNATYHLIKEQQLDKLKDNAILINAGRGAVVDNQALKRKLQTSNLTAILDVFEHEPLVDLELLDLLSFATPHIAGYGLEGKARGTTMIFNAFSEFLKSKNLIEHNEKAYIENLLPPSAFSTIEISSSWQNENLMALCQLIYDIRLDDAKFRQMMANQETQEINFDLMRKNYWNRREYSSITLIAQSEDKLESLKRLGFKVEIKK